MPTNDEQDRILSMCAGLTHRAEEMGAWISGDGRVTESVAADLLGIESGSLANMRYDRRGPYFYRRPGGGARVTYRLMDIATWLEKARDG